MIEYLNSVISPLNIKSIFTAISCAFAIGFERQYFGKPAGIRTSILICLGAYVFVSLSASLLNENTDASRVVGQIVTGIGFGNYGAAITITILTLSVLLGISFLEHLFKRLKVGNHKD